MKSDLQIRISRYVRAANKLTRWRELNGFVPGARVVAKSHNGSLKPGVIAEFGPAWNGNSHMNVPVQLDSGIFQPWCLDQLTLE